jgi:hypothetical protein
MDQHRGARATKNAKPGADGRRASPDRSYLILKLPFVTSAIGTDGRSWHVVPGAV